MKHGEGAVASPLVKPGTKRQYTHTHTHTLKTWPKILLLAYKSIAEHDTAPDKQINEETIIWSTKFQVLVLDAKRTFTSLTCAWCKNSLEWSVRGCLAQIHFEKNCPVEPLVWPLLSILSPLTSISKEFLPWALKVSRKYILLSLAPICLFVWE